MRISETFVVQCEDGSIKDPAEEGPTKAPHTEEGPIEEGPTKEDARAREWAENHMGIHDHDASGWRTRRDLSNG